MDASPMAVLRLKDTLGMVANVADILKYTLKLEPMTAIRPLLKHEQKRGLSIVRDLLDWMGAFLTNLQNVKF